MAKSEQKVGTPGSKEQAASVPPKISLAEFFLNTPPGGWRAIEADWRTAGPQSPGQRIAYFPDLKLDCSSGKCGGPSWFGPDEESRSLQVSLSGESKELFVTYVCKSCEETTKVYAGLFIFNSLDDFGAYKFGELPPMARLYRRKYSGYSRLT
jgi:hypothetical protein